MTRTLELAMAKAAGLPEAAQESLGREILERIAALEALRSEIQAGLDDLDAGLGAPLDIEKLIEELNAEHGGA